MNIKLRRYLERNWKLKIYRVIIDIGNFRLKKNKSKVGLSSELGAPKVGDPRFHV